MSFLDRFTKSVGKAAEQAKFEADKLMRVNKLGSEVSGYAKQIDAAIASMGSKTLELFEAGEIEHEQIAEMVSQIKELRAEKAAKEAELAEAKAGKLEEDAETETEGGEPETESSESEPLSFEE